MKEFNKLSAGLFVLLVGFCAFCIYDNAKSNRGMEIYDTKNLTNNQKDEFKDAINELKKTKQLNLEDKQALYRLASSQYSSKKYRDAEKTLAKLENSEINSFGYWLFRAQNLSYIPTSLGNMTRAAEYYEKSTRIYISKESYMTYELKANIYFNLYKYYRAHRSGTKSATQDELFARQKFFEALADIKRIADERKICHEKTENFKAPYCEKYYDVIKGIYNKLYDEYKTFPNEPSYSEQPAPELQPIKNIQVDIENNKKYSLQYDYPRKK